MDSSGWWWSGDELSSSYWFTCFSKMITGIIERLKLFLQKSDTQQKTDTSDENIFWKALSSSFAEMWVLLFFKCPNLIIKKNWFWRDLKVDLEVFPGATDSRYVRKVSHMVILLIKHLGVYWDFNLFQAGIPAIGFSPINRTKQLLHDHNEYLNRETFIRGIDIYYRIIPKLADCWPNHFES